MQYYIKKYISKIKTNGYCLKNFLFRDKRDKYSNFSNNKRLLSKLKGKSDRKLELKLLANLFTIAISIFF